MHFAIRQFLVELADLRREQQPLVNDGARGKRRNVEEILLAQVGFGNQRFGLLAHDVQLALERVLVHVRCAPDKKLLDVGLRVARQAPDHVAVDGRVAPAKHREAVLAGDLLKHALAEDPLLGVHRQKHHPHAILARAQAT